MIEQIVASDAHKVLVVVGNGFELIQEILERFHVEFVYNSEFASGQTSSIQAAMPHISINKITSDFSAITEDAINQK